MDLWVAILPAGMVLGFLGMFALPFAIIMASGDADRRERARLRAEGVRGEAIVKSFRRVSQTQHRVLIEARLPSGALGRELMVAGLADDWLAHHAALGIPVAIFASPSGSTIVIDRPEDGPVPTNGDTARKVGLLFGGVLLGSVVIGGGISLFHEWSTRNREEALVGPEVRQLRDAFQAKGLEVARMRWRRSKTTGVQGYVDFEFESEASCVVTVRSSDAKEPGSVRGEIQNGRLLLACKASPAKDVARIEAVFRGFHPRG